MQLDKELESLFNNARESLERFYKIQDPEKGIPSLKELKKRDDEDSQKISMSFSVEDKTIKELLELLHHRDPIVKHKVVTKLLVYSGSSNGPVNDEVVNGLRSSFLKPLLLCLNSEYENLQIDSLRLLYQIIDDKTKDEVRKVGGIPIISSLWSSLNEKIILLSIAVTITLSSISFNQKAFKQTKQLPELVKHLESPIKNIRSYTVQALYNLSLLEGNADPLIKAGIVPKIFLVIKAAQHELIESLIILQNISKSKNIQSFIDEEEIKYLASQINLKNLNNESDIEKQSIITGILSNLSSLEKKIDYLVELNLTPTFLNYLNEYGETYVSEELIYNILIYIKNSINSHTGKEQYISYKGYNVIGSMLKQIRTFSSSILNMCSDILASSCDDIINYPYEEFIESSIRSLVEYAQQLPNDGACQVLVSKTINNLSFSDLGRLSIIKLNAFPYLITNALKSKTLDVLLYSFSSLRNLSALPQLSEHFRKMSAALIPILLQYSISSFENLQKESLKFLSAVYSNDEGYINVILDQLGHITLLSLLQSNEDAVSLSLSILNSMLRNSSREQHIIKELHSKGVVKILLSLMTSSNENIQLLSIIISTHICNEGYIKESFISMNVEQVINQLEQHPNAKDSTSLKYAIDTFKIHFTDRLSSQLEDENDPNAVFDNILSKLTKQQLIALVKEAISKGADITETITNMYKANLENPPQKGVKKTVPAPIAPKKAPQSKPIIYSSTTSVFSELQSRLASNDISLRSVEKTKTKSSYQNDLSPMERIFNSIHKNGIDTTSKLIDQSTEEGRKYWLKDMNRFIEEVKMCFVLDFYAMKAIMKILESSLSIISFKEIYSTLYNTSKLTEEEFSESLKKIGFAIKKNTILEGEITRIEFFQIITPIDLPIKEILEVIISYTQIE